VKSITRITNLRWRPSPEGDAQWVEVGIQGDTIQEIITVPKPSGQAGPTPDGTLDAGGSYLSAGLINLHTHLFRKVRPGEGLTIVSNPVASTVRALNNCQDFLNEGVTTVRDLGAPENLDVYLTSLVEKGAVIGPRIIGTGRPLTQTGGHNYDFGLVVDGPDNIRQAVRQQILAGVGWIKVMSSQGGTRHHLNGTGALPPRSFEEGFEMMEAIIKRADADRDYPVAERDGYTLAELTAAADEASRQGVGTAAHAATAQSVINTVQAGITTVEHGTHMNRAAAQVLAKGNSIYVATVSTAFYRILYGASEGWPDFVLRWAFSVAEPWFASVRLAKEYGVRIATGTDAGGKMSLEMQLLERGGFSRHEVMRAATEWAADVLKRPDLGRVLPGAKADLVLFSGDPLEDLQVVEQPVATIKGGKLVVNRLVEPQGR